MKKLYSVVVVRIEDLSVLSFPHLFANKADAVVAARMDRMKTLTILELPYTRPPLGWEDIGPMYDREEEPNYSWSIHEHDYAI